jgi:hypothetical protein
MNKGTLVVHLRFVIDEGNSKFERVHKQTTNVHNNLGALEEHVVCKRQKNVIRDV